MKFVGSTVILLLLALVNTAHAAQPVDEQQLSFGQLSVVDVEPNFATWGQRVTLTLGDDGKAISVSKALGQREPKELELVFVGKTIGKGVAVVHGDTAFAFELFTRSEVPNVWEAFADEANGGKISGLVTISAPGRGGELNSREKLTLSLYKPWQLWFSWAFIALIFGFFVWLASRSDIIRDRTGTAPLPPDKRPFSLARCQMAFWTFIVLGSYLFICLITGDPNASLNTEVVVLLGISASTLLSARLVEVTKSATDLQKLVDSRKQQETLAAEVEGLETQINKIKQGASSPPLSELEKLASLTSVQMTLAERRVQLQAAQDQAKALKDRGSPKPSNGIMDLLDDGEGVSFHRFQMLAWTIILALIFLIYVAENLVMPVLKPELLALMGISSGTYVGLKIPEKQRL